MSSISSDEILHNIKKLSDKYQEIMLLLLQGKGNMIPNSLIDNALIKEMLSRLCNQFFGKPEKFLQINIEYYEKFRLLVESSIRRFLGELSDPLYTPTKKDKRFKDPAWQENIYFDFIKQFYLMSSEWLQRSINQYELEPQLKNYLEFHIKQVIDAISPTNFLFLNPSVLRESIESGWQNIVQGMDNFLQDIKNSEDFFNISNTDKSFFKLGENIAATEGKIIYQNELMQLICYKPKTRTYSVPIFIVPPWINKYYILDLSSHNSLVKFLVDNNFQVFMVSWINPDSKLAHKDFEDYLKEGVLEPIKIIENLGFKKINAAGYCIGGTLLATALAYTKKKKKDFINSASFITTLIDFNNPGEVGIFINEVAINSIEVEMNSKGYFDGRYLSNSFSLLRANDLIWSSFINNYLLGKSPVPFDLLYWNADPTNLPAKMHSFYLRNMYLNNLLKVPHGLKLLGTAIDVSLIDQPCFFLAASEDHIAPWRAVFDGFNLLKKDKTFCLTSAGHVAGVINPPGKTKYNYRINNNNKIGADDWFSSSSEKEGSWWLYWKEWIIPKSGRLGKSIDYNNLSFMESAPGSYVKLNFTF